ncbi:DUF5986 family protein [Bacillus smithii]|uniref:DUF5986 family protein n=1 Tax=Bacillus smithii TaxID=1479 RepID=UPI002E1F4139|nr:DUF5986 family protein [Bacillus smithii]
MGLKAKIKKQQWRRTRKAAKSDRRVNDYIFLNNQNSLDKTSLKKKKYLQMSTEKGDEKMNVAYNIDYPPQFIQRFVFAINEAIESHKEYSEQVKNDPTTNHLGHKRGDEVHKAIVKFVEQNPQFSFTSKVVPSGKSPHKHVQLIDLKRKNLIIVKKVDSVEKLPKKLFNTVDEDGVSQYIQDYAVVNKKYDKQLAMSIEDNQMIFSEEFNKEYNPEMYYQTLAIVTYELDNQGSLKNIAIGVPSHTMDSWIEQKPWSEFIPVSHQFVDYEVGVEDEETPDLGITLKKQKAERNENENG